MLEEVLTVGGRHAAHALAGDKVAKDPSLLLVVLDLALKRLTGVTVARLQHISSRATDEIPITSR